MVGFSTITESTLLDGTNTVIIGMSDYLQSSLSWRTGNDSDGRLLVKRYVTKFVQCMQYIIYIVEMHDLVFCLINNPPDILFIILSRGGIFRSLS